MPAVRKFSKKPRISRRNAIVPEPKPNLNKNPNLRPLLQDIREKLGSDWTFYEECLSGICTTTGYPRNSSACRAWQEQIQQLVDGRDDVTFSHSGVLFLIDEMASRAPGEPTNGGGASGESKRMDLLSSSKRNPTLLTSSSISGITVSKQPTHSTMQFPNPNQQHHSGNAHPLSNMQLAHRQHQHHSRSNKGSTGIARHFAREPAPVSRRDSVDPLQVHQHRMQMKQMRTSNTALHQNATQRPLLFHGSAGTPPRPYLRHPVYDSALEGMNFEPNIIEHLNDPVLSNPAHPGLPSNPVCYDDLRVQREIYEFFGRPNYSVAQQEKIVGDNLESPAPRMAPRRYKSGVDDLEAWKMQIGEDGDVGGGGEMEKVSTMIRMGLEGGGIPFPDPGFLSMDDEF